jgi:hypothetical protein
VSFRSDFAWNFPLDRKVLYPVFGRSVFFGEIEGT